MGNKDQSGLKLGDCDDINQVGSEGPMVSDESSSSSHDSEVPGHVDNSELDEKKNSSADVADKKGPGTGETIKAGASKDVRQVEPSPRAVVHPSIQNSLTGDPMPLFTLSQLASEAVVQNVNPITISAQHQLNNVNTPLTKKSNSLTMLSSESINPKRKMIPTSNFVIMQNSRPVQRKRSESFDFSRNPFSPLQSNISNLRRGKWTAEEEAYVARAIRDFNYGYLDAPAGTTLRTYLSEKLHCDPMRITKKFTGDSCIGKRVFHPAVRCVNNSEAIDKAQVTYIYL